MKNGLKKNLPIAFLILLLIMGLGIMCYPFISNILSKKEQIQTINEYKKISMNYKSEVSSLIEEARIYNKNLTTSTITDVFTNPKEEESKEYKNILNIGKDGVMAYIEIPKIKEEIPIYHGTSTKTLQKGVGHLEGSSYPVGGESTHAVLSAHRGLPSAKLFTDLDQLEKGDQFYIHILEETLAYEVEEIEIIEPFDTEKLTLKTGCDYITLVTCHPYAINTHRLLVRGKRVEYKEENVVKNASLATTGNSDLIFKIGFLLAIAIVIGIIYFLIKINIENQKEKVEII